MARAFSGTEYLQYDASVVSSYPCTMAAWGKTSSDTNTQTLIQLADKDVADQYFAIISDMQNNDKARLLQFSTSLYDEYSTATIATNTWHHVCGTISGTTGVIYLNGAGDSRNGMQAFGPFDRTTIGRTGDSTPGAYYIGSIAEVAIWDVALGGAEVATLAAGYSPLFVRPQSLVAYWPLGGPLCANDADVDVVGGYHMTAYNTPTTADHPPGLIYPSYAMHGFSHSAAAIRRYLGPNFVRQPFSTDSLTRPTLIGAV